MYRITALWVSALFIVLLIVLFAAFLAPFAKIQVKHYQKIPKARGTAWQTNLALECRSLLTNDHPVTTYDGGDLRLSPEIKAIKPVSVEVKTNSVVLIMERGMHSWNYLLRPGNDENNFIFVKQTPRGDETMLSLH
jgi:hypothetical protein